MKKLAFVLVALVAAYGAGFLQVHLEKRRIQDNLEGATSDLEACQERGRVAAVLGRLLALEDATRERNYGDAQGQATEFFDAARDLEASATVRASKDALAEVLGQRDAVIAGLTKSDPAVVDTLRRFELRLRGVLGFDVSARAAAPALPPVAPAPPAATPTP